MGDGIETTAEAAEAAALPAHGATAGAREPAETAPLADRIAEGAAGRLGPAEWAYRRLILYIRNFEATLGDSEEVAVGLTATGTGVMKIEGLGYFDPDIVTFYGRDAAGAKMQLVQHVSQLNLVLKAAPKPDDAAEPRRIGFELVRAIEEDEAGGPAEAT